MKSNAKRNVKEIHPNIHALPHSFIILAAGNNPPTKNFGPKSLLKLPNNESIIERQIRIIRDNFGDANIVVVTGFEADHLMNKLPSDICCVENEHFTDENVARSIGIGLRAATTDKVFLIYGDLIFSDNLFKYHIQESYIVVDKSGLMKNSPIGCNIHEDKAELLMFEGSPKWGQISYFQGDELKLLKSVVWNKDKSKLFGYEVINEIINKDGTIKCVGHSDVKIFDVDAIKDLDKANKL